MILLVSLLLAAISTRGWASSCDYWYESTTHGSAFRNVKDYGAVGDGSTDDTSALQKALTEGRNPNFSLKDPAVVYLPPGEYVISDTLDMYFYTQLIGNAACPPTIRLKESSPGYDNRKYMLSATMDPTGGHTSNFYHKVQNINFVIEDGNEAAVVLHWAVAQATSIRNVVMDLGTGYSGMFCENGGGGFMGDLAVIGGQVGLIIGGQQWTLRNVTIRDTTQTAISQLWDWIFVYVGLTIENTPIGIDFSNGAVGSLIVAESLFRNVSSGIATNYPADVRNIYLQNVRAEHVDSLTPAYANASNNMYNVKAWYQGAAWDKSKRNHKTTGDLDPQRALVQHSMNYHTDAKDVCNVLDQGAKGDGETDDTAALQACMDSDKLVFIPYGAYAVSDTVNISDGTIVMGEGWAQIGVLPHTEAFKNASSPRSMLTMSGTVEVSDLTLVTLDHVQGAWLLEWNAQPDSQMMDVHGRLYHNATGIVHMTPKSGGYIENSWLWTADHDINTFELLNMSVRYGLLVESTLATTLMSTAVEHNEVYNYNISHASNVVAVMTQTETPYWQNPPSAWANTIEHSKDVRVYGTGYYSWFYGNQTDAFRVTDSTGVSVFGHNVHGIVNMFSGDHTQVADYSETFCAGFAVNSPFE